MPDMLSEVRIERGGTGVLGGSATVDLFELILRYPRGRFFERSALGPPFFFLHGLEPAELGLGLGLGVRVWV